MEEGIGGDVAGEGGEVVDGLADVLGEEVAGEVGVDGVDYAGEVVGGGGQGLCVAGVGDDEAFRVTGFSEGGGEGVESLDEFGDALACFCGNGKYCDVGAGNVFHAVDDRRVQGRQEVGFVEGEDDGCGGGFVAEVGDGGKDGVGALSDVGHGDDEGGAAYGVVGAFDAELFDGVAGLAESGCVHQAEYLAAG